MLGLGLLANVVTGWVGDYQKGREHKREISEAVTKNKIRLAESEQTHNQNWELSQIEGKDKILRRLSFALMSAPFVIAIFNPDAVNEYFSVGLASMPEWFQYQYMAILGAIWGISEFKKWK